MKILLILALTIFNPNDSTIKIYRRGLDRFVIPKKETKINYHTPKRKILYTYKVSSLEFKNNKKGKVKK